MDHASAGHWHLEKQWFRVLRPEFTSGSTMYQWWDCDVVLHLLISEVSYFQVKKSQVKLAYVEKGLYCLV